MTELEKLDAGLEYDFWDEEVNARKLHAIDGCARLNRTPVTDAAACEAAVRTFRRRRPPSNRTADLQLRQRPQHPGGR